MANREVSITILCEDLQQEVFIRQWLQALGFKTQKMRILRSPSGRGAGEQFVKERYAIEVQAHRARSTYRQVSLVVAIDADIMSVAERQVQLSEQLQTIKQSPRSESEQIALLIPKRNIETWIYAVAGVEVDEVTIYAKLPNESQCKESVWQFVRTHQYQEELNSAPNSLQVAWHEMKRIL